MKRVRFDLSDECFAEAERRAAGSGVTVASVIVGILEGSLAPSPLAPGRMCRAELMRAVLARGAVVQPHVIEYLAQTGKLVPAPVMDASHRREFVAGHVDQVVAHVTRSRA